ncbi:MAG: RNA methyltransferase [Desulfocapsaceae bacterium]|jgi:hypothetical protein|nr:RNA methyltransferase [Desulfocapsaceae bacterium]
MNKERNKALDIVLIHYPVINKTGETIGSAVTNLDLHDIARAARTFGVDHYYIVTPYSDQQTLVQEILDHWQTGYGATYNPARKSALDRVKIAASLDEVITLVTEQRAQKPLLLTTSARVQKNSISYRETRKRIAAGEPILLLFGTAHGLAPELSETADYTLPPIESTTGYNHLSVRSAVSIILDRLLGVHEGL